MGFSSSDLFEEYSHFDFSKFLDQNLRFDSIAVALLVGAMHIAGVVPDLHESCASHFTYMFTACDILDVSFDSVPSCVAIPSKSSCLNEIKMDLLVFVKNDPLVQSMKVSVFGKVC